MYDENGDLDEGGNGYTKRIITLLMIIGMILSLFYFPNGKTFCNDTGNTNNTNSKNPQTAVVENVMQQEMIVEFQNGYHCN